VELQSELKVNIKNCWRGTVEICLLFIIIRGNSSGKGYESLRTKRKCSEYPVGSFKIPEVFRRWYLNLEMSIT
jgi:hypothetical protein